MTLYNIGLTYKNEQDFLKALEYYNKVKPIFELQLKSDHIFLIRLLKDIDMCVAKIQQWES